jgi:hypothetical protein
MPILSDVQHQSVIRRDLSYFWCRRIRKKSTLIQKECSLAVYLLFGEHQFCMVYIVYIRADDTIPVVYETDLDVVCHFPWDQSR